MVGHFWSSVVEYNFDSYSVFARMPDVSSCLYEMHLSQHQLRSSDTCLGSYLWGITAVVSHCRSMLAFTLCGQGIALSRGRALRSGPNDLSYEREGVQSMTLAGVSICYRDAASLVRYESRLLVVLVTHGFVSCSADLRVDPSTSYRSAIADERLLCAASTTVHSMRSHVVLDNLRDTSVPTTPSSHCVRGERCLSILSWAAHAVRLCVSLFSRDYIRYTTTTSTQKGLPAELKHISKRRKRNQ